jgi:outer membrane cobalamin receptor
MDLLVSVKNAFGASYSTIDTYPMPNCSVTVGLRFTYETM